ncbi:MAG: 1-acyl-sn-glycerol-3-phosphate acyltransferase [bacterium ADurb.Bin363]|nr:MAG: 1-acyl-sn-glycerol-3-phosphate acyltransferase [bacterium ADurb.Bin363]
MRKYFVALIHLIVTVILSSLSVFFSLFDSTGESQHWCAHNWGKGCVWGAGIKLSVSGLSNINGKGPFIFASNHQSYLDIWVLLTILPVSFRFVAKKSLFSWPFIGWHLQRSGQIPIDRSKTTAGARSLIEAVKRVKDGTNIVIFPEGSRSEKNTLGEFKKGAFFLAAKTGVPLIPIILKNTATLFPNTGLFVYPGTVEAIILPPIDTTEFGPKKVEELMEHTRKIMSEYYPSQQ